MNEEGILKKVLSKKVKRKLLKKKTQDQDVDNRLVKMSHSRKKEGTT
jgi:hypothetical protein